MDQTPELPEQRAADADREVAAEVLRAAGVDGRLSTDELEHRLSVLFATRTHPEIDALLVDLQGRQGLATRALATEAAPAGAAARSGIPETATTVTVMSESKRNGFWRPAADSRVITVMGESEIDLTEADLSRPVTYLRVLTVMGTASIRVPDGVQVHVSKLGIMGSNDVDLGDSDVSPDAPQLHLRLISIMAEGTVRRGRRWAKR